MPIRMEHDEMPERRPRPYTDPRTGRILWPTGSDTAPDLTPDLHAIADRIPRRP